MSCKYKIGVIGAGFMASAIVSGAIRSNVVSPSEVIVSDVFEPALLKMTDMGVATTTDNLYLVNNSEFVLFAVKPQSLSEVLEGIKTGKCTKFLSIMAGVKKQRIKDCFALSKVARCMPNTPCAIGSGAVGLDVSDFEDESDIAFIKNLLSSLAKVVFVSEDQLGAVTGVSGSSPAYFYLFLKGIIDAGVKNGLSYNDAKSLAVNTMIGSGKMVLENPDKSLDDLINAVCSKGGTTIQAVNVYNEGGLSDLTLNAVNACIKRSKELENL
ncbi:MAG: pyrroline-5-carboxylate reductase [Clostridiales bacterium]|nr:pyrroline-5-carboxylate reductase [Clostridiales bacterium]